MKRIALMVAASLAFGSALAEYNFAGLKWGISEEEFLSQIDTSRYTFYRKFERVKANNYAYNGIVSNYKASFTFRFDLKGTLQNISIVTDELDNPCQAYESIVDSLTKKYGKSEDKVDNRSNQYKDITSCTQLSQGIRLGDVYLNDYWGYNSDDGLSIETLKGGMIRIDYFGPLWEDEYNRRQKGDVDDL